MYLVWFLSAECGLGVPVSNDQNMKFSIRDSFCNSLREKCPNTEYFLVRIQSQYRKIRTRKNSVFGHFYEKVLRKPWICSYFSEKLSLETSFVQL